MPEKIVRREGLPLLVRHTGRTTLPEDPPFSRPEAHARSRPEAHARSRPEAHARSLKSGASIVCLHDAGLQSSVFDRLLEELEAGGENGLAFDLPGHGRSGSLDSLPSIEAMTEMSRWVAEWCRIERPVLVGHGMGALVALEWARSHPGSVAGLVLCGVGAALGLEDETIERMRQVTRGKASRPFDPTRISQDAGADLMRRVYMEGLKTDPRATLVDLEASRAWADALRVGVPSGEPGGVSAIAAPTRILSGAAERPADREQAESLASRLIRARSEVVEGAAYFLPLEKPSALAAGIRRCERDAAEAA